MVVLAVAICTGAGKPILSRQFVEMSRFRIEGLLASFPKLMESGDKQHTYFETDSVRYVYHPMDELYLVLLTTKGSNIVDDLQTLYTLSQITMRVVGQFSEEAIQEARFEIIFAFDEVISMGYSESVSPDEVMIQLEMESAEEKVHNIIQQSKMMEAKDLAKRKAKQIQEEQRRKKRQQRELGGMGGMGGGGPGVMGMGPMGSYGGGGGGSGGYAVSEQSRMTMGGGGGGGIGGGGTYGGPTSSSSVTAAASAAASAQAKRPARRGMRLGAPRGEEGGGGGSGRRGGGAGGLMAQLANEEGVDMSASAPIPVPASARRGPGAGGGSSRAPVPPQPTVTNGLAVNITEKLDVVLSEGDLQQGSSSTLSGVVQFRACDEDSERAMVKVAAKPSDGVGAGVIEWKRLLKTHPSHVDKKVFQKDAVIKSKRGKKFDQGKVTSVIKWSVALKENTKEILMPLAVTAWVDEEEQGRFRVVLEYELNEGWTKVSQLEVDVHTGGCENVEFDGDGSSGNYNWLSRENLVTWGVELIEGGDGDADEEGGGATGQLEFLCSGGNVSKSNFFPIMARFRVQDRCACPLTAKAAKGPDGPVPLHFSRNLIASYEIVE